MGGKRGVKLSPENEKRILAALVLHSGNISAVARELGFSKSTVHGVAKKSAGAGNPIVSPESPPLETMDQDEVRKTAYVSAGAIVFSKGEILKNIQGALKVRPNVLMRKSVDGTEDQFAIAAVEAVRPWVSMLKDLNISYGIEIQNARLLNDQPTSIFDTVKDLIKMPEDVTTDDLVTVLKASIHGRKALAAPTPPAGAAVPPPVRPTPQRSVIYQPT